MKNKRLLSLGLTAVLAVSACGCSQSAETVEETAEGITEETAGEAFEAAKITERAAGRSAGGNAEKEETVYVNADAGGAVKEITVSSWLKNSSGAAELTDVTTLTDVVNVKGDETFTRDGDTYVWAAEGNDIYYQGSTSEELPVEVKVTYYLDGQEIAPGELAGKSGRVRIRFDYENRSRQQMMIGGKETELCVPFLAASTLILDSDRFVNVEVENGKILSDGKNTIVAGVAMPGLYDSLDLLNLEGFEDMDIPEYVEVTADVTDFELAMTATLLMPDVFSELNTDDMDGFDDLKDDIEELNDATYDLIDGCIELDDGVQELKDNMPDLWDGAVELDDGAAELNDGAWELYDGAQDLKDGADKLNDGAKELREGAKELDAGTGNLQAAAGLLKNGVDQLAAGVGGMGHSLEQAIAENQEKMQAAQTNVVLLTGKLEKAVKEAKALQAQLTELAEQMGLLSPGSSAEQGTAAEAAESEEVRTEAPDSVQADAPSARPESQEKTGIPEGEEEESSSIPENQNGTGTAAGDGEELPDASDTTGEVDAASESGRESSDASDIPDETGSISGGGSGSSAASGVPDGTGVLSGNGDGLPGASENSESTDAASGEKSSSDPDTPKETGIVSERGAETSSAPENTAEDPASEPEKLTDEDLEVSSEAEDSLEEAEELSEFAGNYLESLSASDGMVSVNMVRLADAGQGTGTPADAETIIKGYQKVVALQVDLIGKLNEITELQNQLREAATDYAGLVGADTALKQIAGQLSSKMDAGQLTQLTEGMAGLKTGADTLKTGTAKLYKGGIDLREGTKELYDGTVELEDGTEELKDGTMELKDGTVELKDGVADLVDGVDELKDGTEELLDGVHEYNDDGIQKLYDTVNEDLQNLLDRVDAVSDLSSAYQSFSGKSDGMEGSVKFIIETEAIELEEEEN